jgi:hypothetical protein
MYYAIEIDYPLFLSGSFRVFTGFFLDFPGIVPGCLGDVFWVVLDVDLSSLFIVGELSHRV